MATLVKSYAGGLTAATAISATPVTLHGFTVNATNTGGASTITIWDNPAAAAGTILWQKTIATQTAANTQTYNFLTPVKALTGITVTVATTAVGDVSFWLN
jgi:hypothetical protein